MVFSRFICQTNEFKNMQSLCCCSEVAPMIRVQVILRLWLFKYILYSFTSSLCIYSKTNVVKKPIVYNKLCICEIIIYYTNVYLQNRQAKQKAVQTQQSNEIIVLCKQIIYVLNQWFNDYLEIFIKCIMKHILTMCVKNQYNKIPSIQVGKVVLS